MNKNLLTCKNRYEFREWLEKNHLSETECWIIVKKGKPQEDSNFYYLDAVEEALCFGWIDSIHKTIPDFGHAQKFSPRKEKSQWSELNKERCKRLEKLGLMTPNGRNELEKAKPFKIDDDILLLLQKDKQTWQNFQNFPELYKRVRINTIQRERNKKELFKKSLEKFIQNTSQNIMYGDWNDYGRLNNY